MAWRMKEVEHESTGEEQVQEDDDGEDAGAALLAAGRIQLLQVPDWDLVNRNLGSL